MTLPVMLQYSVPLWVAFLAVPRQVSVVPMSLTMVETVAPNRL